MLMSWYNRLSPSEKVLINVYVDMSTTVHKVDLSDSIFTIIFAKKINTINNNLFKTLNEKDNKITHQIAGLV